MLNELNFSVWAPSKQVFLDSWVTAGIMEIVDGEYVYTSAYPGIEYTHTWSGIIVKTPGTYDSDGNELTAPVMVNGWHTNVKVTDPGLIAQFTHGIDQYEEDGTTLKDVMDRTWATAVFGLTQVDEDPSTNFPPGEKNTDNVVYTDPKNFSSPSNTIA